MATSGKARHGWALGVGASLACTAALSFPVPAGAALISVSDEADDLLMEADDGDCALREAIEAANRNTAVDQCSAGEAEPASDTVLLADGATYVLTGAADDDANGSGDLDFNTIADSGPATLEGGSDGGSVIDGGGTDRVLDLRGSTSLENLTITNGAVTIWGGGIRNTSGVLSVTRSRISGNTAVLGGGIANLGAGTLRIAASVVSGNTVAPTTVEPVAGGGIVNEATATIDGSVISSNDAAGVGGQPTAGAGIANLDGGGLTVTDSTISGNAMSGGMQFGAGVDHEAGGSSLSIRNSTIAGNLAPGSGADGGGLNSFGGQVALNHVTFSGNHADGGGDAISNFGGAPVSLRASVIDDGASACRGVASGGFNVDAGATCASAQNSTDLQNATTGLDLHLVDHGGQPAGPSGSAEVPKTYGLLVTSPALDRVPAAQCFDVGATPLATDQRGFARPDGPGCDSGAFEQAIPIAVTSGEPTSSLATPPQQQLVTRKCKRKKRRGARAKRRCKKQR